MITYKDCTIGHNYLYGQHVASIITAMGGMIGGAKGATEAEAIANAKKKVDNAEPYQVKMIKRHAKQAAR